MVTDGDPVSADDLRNAYRDWLHRLGTEGRADFVDAARRNEDWPEPADGYLASHASKWGRGRRPDQYAQWAYELENCPGVQVYAYIHPVHGNRGLAFVDLEQDAIVQFDCERNLNFDCITPPNGARRWVADKEAMGAYWRLKDTER